MLQKSFSAKVFSADGVSFLKTFPASSMKNEPTFRSRMNGGLGEYVIDLDLPFDDFDEGTSIDFMNIVDLYATDEANPRGRRLYRGYTSRYEPYIQGGAEGVRLTVLGLVSLLSRSYYKNGSSFTVTHSTQDPTVIFKAVIDHFNTVYGGNLITYDASSIPATVGTSVSITFTDTKHFDALKKVAELAGTGWWWHIDENGKAIFKAKPSTATHTFTVAKDIIDLSCVKDSEKVVNDLVVRRNGGTETSYSDATSQMNFGTGSPASGKASKIISDSALTDVNAADQRGNKDIADNKDEKIRASLTISPEYDLESIKVGETAKVRNFKKANAFFSDSMQIVGLTYSPDSVALELEEHGADFGLTLAQFLE